MSESNILPQKKLWNPKSFIIFSMFFSFLPAGIMYALNYGRCGNKKNRWTYLLATIIAFIAIFTLCIIIPKSIAKTLFLSVNIALGIYFMRTQQKLYIEHIQNGGKRASYFLPITICLIITGLIIAAMIYCDFIPDNSIKYNKNELYYTDNITNSEAKKVGDYLESEGFFDNTSQISTKIDKQNNIYILSVIVNGDYSHNKKLIAIMYLLSNDISKNVLDNAKVRIDLCNNRFKVLKSLD
ncbi:hypothetical protein ACJDT4_03010 [Clostridium neuense]|uniref:Uncharacterized protein n=1 Tax=Clostridium neuense TaxID=1728934 RepID=A0ABW8TA19_9CLOT